MPSVESRWKPSERRKEPLARGGLKLRLKWRLKSGGKGKAVGAAAVEVQERSAALWKL